MKFYINGYNDPTYFDDIHDAFMNAKRSIMILDWWLTPELYLKRPIEKYPHS